MTHLFITEDGAKLTSKQHRLVIRLPETESKELPVETVESLSLFGNFSISSRVVTEFLKRCTGVYFYSRNGSYFGRLMNSDKVNVARQRQQVTLSGNTPFAHELARRIVQAKIRNQLSLLRAYDADKALDEASFAPLNHSLYWVQKARTLNEIIGFEGNAAKAYFAAVAKLVPPDFHFKGRTKRPPKEPVSSLLSFGYTLLFRNIVGAIERHGMHPYFGFLHVDREGHAALASDLMEEWRTIIVDDTVISLLNTNMLQPPMFTRHLPTGGIRLTKEAMRIFVHAIREKMLVPDCYVPFTDNLFTFQSALDSQLDSLARALEKADPTYYTPVGSETTAS
jgi:CRISPR-associated protein Cas1